MFAFHFRFKLRVTCSNFHEIILLLANCTSLVRLSLIVTSIDGLGEVIDMYKWNEIEFIAFFVNLVKRLPKLIALLVVLPGASESHCAAATTTLLTIYRPKRPCFCVQITD